MMKKVFISLLLVALFIAFASCDSHEQPVETEKESTVEESMGKESEEALTDPLPVQPELSEAFETVGLYVWDSNPSQFAFWKKTGINTLQFCDRGWWYNAKDGSLDSYLTNMASGVRQAKSSGFKVYVILFSNIEQFEGPGSTEPTGIGVKFHPDDAEKWNERLEYLKKTVSRLKMADGFTFFAGDPGGIPNSLGEGSVENYIKMAIDVKNMVAETAPDAEFHINPWAISMFQTPNVSAETPQFWQRETENSKIILGWDGLIGKDAGIELPCHDYYRPLALRLYAKYGLVPEQKYPQNDDMDILKSRGTEQIWAWPYFLLDEADDGDNAGDRRTDLPQIDTRYIFRYLNDVRELGFNGVIGSWSYAGYQNKCLNTYAFARMAKDNTVTPEMVITEFSELIETEQTAKAFADILRFVENDCNFEKKLPKSERIEPLPTSFADANEARKALASVNAVDNPAISLPISPKEYLSKIEERLKLMINQG